MCVNEPCYLIISFVDEEHFTYSIRTCTHRATLVYTTRCGQSYKPTHRRTSARLVHGVQIVSFSGSIAKKDISSKNVRLHTAPVMALSIT